MNIFFLQKYDSNPIISNILKVPTDFLLGLNDVEDNNIDDKKIHKHTGLSDKAIKVLYPQGVKAVTPGQACVLYLNDECIAGGIIEEVYDKNNDKISYI